MASNIVLLSVISREPSSWIPFLAPEVLAPVVDLALDPSVEIGFLLISQINILMILEHILPNILHLIKRLKMLSYQGIEVVFNFSNFFAFIVTILANTFDPEYLGSPYL
jgi:hypothetical protein